MDVMYKKLLAELADLPPDSPIPDEFQRRLVKHLKRNRQSAEHFAGISHMAASLLTEDETDVPEDLCREVETWILEQIEKC